MNYDTLLERLMMFNRDSKLEYPAPLQDLRGIWSQNQTVYSDYSSNLNINEFRGRLYPILYKLHGSVSWYSLDPFEANAPIYCLEMNKDYVYGINIVSLLS
jgi:hypothetical protein